MLKGTSSPAVAELVDNLLWHRLCATAVSYLYRRSRSPVQSGRCTKVAWSIRQRRFSPRWSTVFVNLLRRRISAPFIFSKSCSAWGGWFSRVSVAYHSLRQYGHTELNTLKRDNIIIFKGSSNVPANTKHLYNMCTTSAQRLTQRLRRWSNIVQIYVIQMFCDSWDAHYYMWRWSLGPLHSLVQLMWVNYEISKT